MKATGGKKEKAQYDIWRLGYACNSAALSSPGRAPGRDLIRSVPLMKSGVAYTG